LDKRDCYNSNPRARSQSFRAAHLEVRRIAVLPSSGDQERVAADDRERNPVSDAGFTSVLVGRKADIP
jgi:hypothetical protein